MKKIVLVSVIVAGLASYSFSQNINDVLRYSSLSYNGTARFMGLSGAYGALGADFSSLSQNPAGIALYRKSEFTITPGFFSANAKSSYLQDPSKSDFRNNVTLGNLGMVFNADMDDKNKGSVLKGIQLGFGMNRTNDFSQKILAEGYNKTSSLLGLYARESNAGNGSPYTVNQLDEFSSLLAYNTNLMVYDSSSLEGIPWWVDLPDGMVMQRKSLELSGSSREMVLSGGANFNNMLFFGLSLCFPSVRYYETSHYSEVDINNESSNADPEFNFLKMNRTENLTTKGNGFNLKAGFIFMPVEYLRIGGAIHTRTTYNMTDDYSAEMTSYFENGDIYTAKSPNGSYDYQIVTPMSASGSLAVLFGKVGLISADYEVLDYSSAKIRSNDDPFSDVNDSINRKLGLASNLRFGAEAKFGMLALRAGTSYYGSPYKNENTLAARMGYSFGLGFREKDYFLDFAFNHQPKKDNIQLYNDPSAIAKNTYSTNQFQVTLGLRF
jgi:hypothetical protein